MAGRHQNSGDRPDFHNIQGHLKVYMIFKLKCYSQVLCGDLGGGSTENFRFWLFRVD